MPDFTITLTDCLEPADVEVVRKGLEDFDASQGALIDWVPLALYARTADGTIVAGLTGSTYWGYLYVGRLWTAERCRQAGLGSRLLHDAEQEALRRGCHAVHLMTGDFNALPFYQKRGYDIFGRLPDMPAGHTQYFMWKELGEPQKPAQKLVKRPLNTESDYFRARNFLREVFLLNNRLEDSWHVARLDYWRWHLIATCQVTPPFGQVTVGWETPQGELAAILHPYGGGELRTHIHPRFRSPELEAEVYTYAVEHFAEQTENSAYLIAPVLADDTLRQETLSRLGFAKQAGWNHHYWRDLDAPLPEAPAPAGYVIRSMGDESEHASRSWCSWRAFHSDEPASNYDGDFSWYKNIQSALLYRRDLDVVAAAPDGQIAGFCTIYYDDYTRSAVTVLVGVAAEHWRRGLGKAVMLEGMHRLRRLGCIRVFSTANEEPADALYRSVMTDMRVTDTWVKQWNTA